MLTQSMRPMTIEKRTFLLPECWKDVTLTKFNAALAAIKSSLPREREAKGRAISALCDIPEAYLLSMTRQQVDQISEIVAFFFETQPEPKLLMEFKLDGTIFLVPESIEKQTFGEFIDLDNAMLAHKDSPREALPAIFAIYCRPAGEVYDSEDLAERTKQRIELFGKLDMELAEGLAAFFLTKAIERNPITNQYGQLRVSLITRVRLLRSLLANTVGWRRLSVWHKKTFLKFLRSRIGNADTYLHS